MKELNMTACLRLLLSLVLSAAGAAAQSPREAPSAPAPMVQSRVAAFTPAEAEDYSLREMAAPELADFEGGNDVVVALLVGALVVIIILLLI
jgi:hypothetical protein